MIRDEDILAQVVNLLPTFEIMQNCDTHRSPIQEIATHSENPEQEDTPITGCRVQYYSL